ncbi:hypothetical protein M433DRAFT_1515 [Acidomyces richmondensis BFW]|nr:MAG: hypothetical protein FE78DRAFT_26382 [Acidomyces sp. 'richmondensis']KYG48995.1 hypothetical protein M433DRAFT_1515 [Acidomyces richmondensis BFW]
MSTMVVDQRLISGVFPPEICARISAAVLQHPAPNDLAELFHDVARILESAYNQVNGREPSNKKRKLHEDILQVNGAIPASTEDAKSVFSCKDVSFQVPARKKLKLDIAASARDQRRQEIRLENEKTGQVEYKMSADQIDQAFCLPVPEKQLRQWNFVLFPKAGAVDPSGTLCEQIVFTMNETPPAGACSPAQPEGGTDTFVTVTERELNRVLHFQGKHVVIPNVAEFSSSIPQSHRKGEKAYHVKAHRGSKEGYLFFLENGIVFGFKKPLAFFPFANIESISYTSVLQRTFNLVIATRDIADSNSEVKEIEFSMLDQADFSGIDEYVKRHGLNDASMAAERRAKAYNVNKDKRNDVLNEDNEGPSAADESELQRAEMQLQDEEDELEEDYQASGGDSDGSGSESEDEEYEYGDHDDEEGADEVEHEEDVHDEG